MVIIAVIVVVVIIAVIIVIILVVIIVVFIVIIAVVITVVIIIVVVVIVVVVDVVSSSRCWNPNNYLIAVRWPVENSTEFFLKLCMLNSGWSHLLKIYLHKKYN